MRLDEVRIRAMDGSVLLDGELTLEGEASALRLLARPSFQAIGVKLAPRFGQNWQFQAYDRIECGADGLYAAPPPVFSVAFGPTVPTFNELADLSRLAGRHAISLDGQGVQLARFYLPYAHPEPDQSPTAFCHADQLELVLDASAEGVAIQFRAVAAGMVSVPDGLSIEGAVLRCRVFVPRAALTLLGLPKVGSPDADAEGGQWKPGKGDLADIAISTYGGLLVEGQVNWQQGVGQYDPCGPFVSLGITDHAIGLAPVVKVTRFASGLCRGDRVRNDGPHLKIPLGIADFARMLAVEDRVETSWRGAGIGHIEGRTGRDAYEEGSLTQQLEWLTLQLERSSAGLHVRGEGEFLPLPAGSKAHNLGPKLDFEFFLPRTLIMVRGLDLPRFHEDRKREMPAEGAW